LGFIHYKLFGEILWAAWKWPKRGLLLINAEDFRHTCCEAGPESLRSFRVLKDGWIAILLFIYLINLQLHKEKKMKFKSYIMAILLELSLISGVANAAGSWTEVTEIPPPSGELNLNGGITVNYSDPSTVAQIFWYDANLPGGQGPDNVASAVSSVFGISTPTLVSQDDSFTTGDISSDPFNYLAVHFGSNELLFSFLSPVTSFEITTSGQGAGLSNYRTYSGSPVPVPAAVWLFGSGLAGLISSARRKLKAVI